MKFQLFYKQYKAYIFKEGEAEWELKAGLKHSMTNISPGLYLDGKSQVVLLQGTHANTCVYDY